MIKNSLPMRFYFLAFVTLFSGCGSERCPTLPGGVGYCLQPPAAGPAFSVLQKVVIVEGERQEILLARTENNPERLALVGVTPLGQTVLTLNWDGDHVVTTGQPGMPPRLNPSVLVAVLQFALWPKDKVRAGLPENVLWEDGEDGGQLMLRGESLLTVRRTGRSVPYETMNIELPRAGLSLHIRTLPEDECCTMDNGK